MVKEAIKQLAQKVKPGDKADDLHPREINDGDFEVSHASPLYSSQSRPAALYDLAELSNSQTALDGLTHAPGEPPKDLDIHTPAEKGPVPLVVSTRDVAAS